MCVSLVSLSFFLSCVFFGSSFPMRPCEHLGLQTFGFVIRICYGALKFKARPSFLSCLLYHASKSINKGPSEETGGMVPKAWKYSICRREDVKLQHFPTLCRPRQFVKLLGNHSG